MLLQPLRERQVVTNATQKVERQVRVRVDEAWHEAVRDREVDDARRRVEMRNLGRRHYVEDALALHHDAVAVQHNLLAALGHGHDVARVHDQIDVNQLRRGWRRTRARSCASSRARAHGDFGLGGARRNQQGRQPLQHKLDGALDDNKVGSLRRMEGLERQRLLANAIGVIVDHAEHGVRQADLAAGDTLVRRRHANDVAVVLHHADLALGLESRAARIAVDAVRQRVQAAAAQQLQQRLAQRRVEGGHEVRARVGEDAAQVEGAPEVVAHEHRADSDGQLERADGADADDGVAALVQQR